MDERNIRDRESQLLAAILKTAVDAIIVIDQQGIVRIINDACAGMFGYDREELVGKKINQLMPTPDRQQHDGYLQNYLATGVAKIIGIGREVSAQRKDGTIFPIHLSISEVVFDDERWFAGIIQDISEAKLHQQQLTQLNEQLERRVEEQTQRLRNAQAELVRAEKLATLGQVAGGIAHEIRNPLSVVRTSAFFLRRAENPPAEKVQEHLERIERQVGLIDNVVTALVDVAKMPAAKLSKCDVRQVVEDVKQGLIIPPEIKFQVSFPDRLPAANIDSSQVAIVFRNLFRNAFDAMVEGGRISVSGRESDGQIVVEVADNGPGIAAEDLQRILEPLFSTKARGMGLGLAICVVVLEKNSGYLKVQSALGVGTTVAVHLPIYQMPSE